jgi:hypothetical protein
LVLAGCDAGPAARMVLNFQAMEINQKLTFTFSHMVDGVNYGFSILAESKEVACEKLLKAMAAITEELKGALKAPTKPN